MEFPVTIDSQDAFDALVKDRLGREKAKYADYDDLKTQVQTLTEAQKDHEKALAAATSRAETAESTLADRDKATALEKVRAEVAAAAKVPVEALRGGSKEELEAHAEVLKPLFTASRGPVIPSQGDEPDKKPTADDERAFARDLFAGE